MLSSLIYTLSLIDFTIISTTLTPSNTSFPIKKPFVISFRIAVSKNFVSLLFLSRIP